MLGCAGILLAALLAECRGAKGAEEGSRGTRAHDDPIDAWLWHKDTRHYGEDQESIRAAARRLKGLLDGIVSADAQARRTAVVELMKVRALLSTGLQQIVADANRKECGEGSKASALFLMGELGLQECRDILQKEKDWEYRVPGRYGFGHYRRREDVLSWCLAIHALDRASFGDACRFVGYADTASPKDYPELAGALQGLRSTVRLDRRHAEDVILMWNRELATQLNRCLKGNRPSGKYPEDVRVTAAFLLGEWRAFSQMLEWFVDLQDKKKITLKYPHSLDAKWIEPDLPCADALLKVGRRCSPRQVLGRIETWETLAPETRRRLARILMRVQPDRTRTEFQKEMGWLTRPGSTISEAEKASRASRLRVIEPIIMKDRTPGTAGTRR